MITIHISFNRWHVAVHSATWNPSTMAGEELLVVCLRKKTLLLSNNLNLLFQLISEKRLHPMITVELSRFANLYLSILHLTLSFLFPDGELGLREEVWQLSILPVTDQARVIASIH